MTSTSWNAAVICRSCGAGKASRSAGRSTSCHWGRAMRPARDAGLDGTPFRTNRPLLLRRSLGRNLLFCVFLEWLAFAIETIPNEGRIPRTQADSAKRRHAVQQPLQRLPDGGRRFLWAVSRPVVHFSAWASAPASALASHFAPTPNSILSF